MIAPGLSNIEYPLAGAERVEAAFGLRGPSLCSLQFSLELFDAHDVRVGDGFLLFQLSLVHLDLLVEMIQEFLKDEDVLAILLGLEQKFLE